MQFIKRATEPKFITIAGNKYPAIYNFKAIQNQEDVSGISHVITTTRISQNIPTAMDIVSVLYGMLTAAGVETTPDDVAEGVLLSDEKSIVDQIIDIMNNQMPEVPEGETKNVSRAMDSIGTN